MSLFTVPHVALCGIASCVPRHRADNLEEPVLPEKERELFVKTTGIRYRRLSPEGQTASDLCLAAAEKLLAALNWSAEEISVLVFITQTPDYIIPNTASWLHRQLGLGKNCMAFDVNLGCSGYVYGLSIVATLLQNMPRAKALLLVGDVSSKIISSEDKSTVPLFSDAGSATALVYKKDSAMHFNLQTDGGGLEDIMVPHGGFRHRLEAASYVKKEYGPGIVRSDADMKLDGLRIFNFALREVAPNIRMLMSTLPGCPEPDFCVLHQANLLMLENVRKKLPYDALKVPCSLYDFGNTGAASIPVTLVSQLRETIEARKCKLVLSGFGVGLSWGSVYLETDNLVCPEMLEI